MRSFFTIVVVVLFFSSFFVKMAVFFVFLRNIPLPIEILEIKFLDYSYPTSQYFFINKAFIRSFRVTGRLRCAIWQNGTKAYVEPCLDAGQSFYSLALFSVDVYFRANVTIYLFETSGFRIFARGADFRSSLKSL